MDTAMKTIRVENARAERRGAGPGGFPFVLAFLCLSFGLFAPLLGLIFIIIHVFLAADQTLGEIGTGLMIASIPLLLAGSHFLDVREKQRRQRENSGLQKDTRAPMDT